MAELENLKQIQKKIDDWINDHGGYWSPLAMLASIIEEVGELAREINNLEGFKPKKPTEDDMSLGEEVADLLFSVICIANYYKINLNEKLNEVLLKYSARDSKRFI